MEYTAILLEKMNGIAKLTMNRPETMNSLNSWLLNDLYYGLQECKNDSEVRCIVLTGAGRGFCSGADLRGGGTPDLRDADLGMERYNRVIRTLREVEKPIIASINGAAVGAGANIPLACDIRIAGERARFGEVFVRIGLSPDSGAGYHLWRLVGIGKATELMFTGDIIDGAEMERIGLVNKLVPDEDLDKVTMEWATKLAKGPTRAIGLAKKILNLGLELPLHSVLDFEAYGQHLTGITQDNKEGVNAFMERREPNFTGR